MKIKKTLVVMLFLCFVMTSISSYATMGRKYSEIQLAPDTFIIGIQATETTSPDKALSGLLTRAAEVTLRNGYKYFTVTHAEDQSELKSSSYFGYGSGSTKVSKIPHGQMTIKCFANQSKSNDYIEAEFFLKNKKK